jgi:hypothetical protein
LIAVTKELWATPLSVENFLPGLVRQAQRVLPWRAASYLRAMYFQRLAGLLAADYFPFAAHKPGRSNLFS